MEWKPESVSTSGTAEAPKGAAERLARTGWDPEHARLGHKAVMCAKAPGRAAQGPELKPTFLSL